jgi:hypothetical protein
MEDRGFESRWGLGIFLFTTTSRTALGPTQPPIQWVPGALSLGVKRPGREADHLPPSSAEVKEWVEVCYHSRNTPSWRGAVLKLNTVCVFQTMSLSSRGINQYICYVFTLMECRCAWSLAWNILRTTRHHSPWFTFTLTSQGIRKMYIYIYIYIYIYSRIRMYFA